MDKQYIGRTCGNVMLDQKKIRLMTRTAIYEKRAGEEDFKITSYYQKDYSSLNTWTTLIWITVGFVLAAGLFFLCGGEDLLEGITILKLLILMAVAVGLYLVLLIVYGIGVGAFYRKKYTRAKRRVKRYLRDLSRLEKMNSKKEISRS